MAAACCKVTPVPPPVNTCKSAPERSPQLSVLSELQALRIRAQAAGVAKRRNARVARVSGRHDVIEVLIDLAVTGPPCFIIQGVIVQKPLAAVSRQRPEVQIGLRLTIDRQEPLERKSQYDALFEAALAELREGHVCEGCKRPDFYSGLEVARDLKGCAPVACQIAPAMHGEIQTIPGRLIVDRHVSGHHAIG